MEEDKLTTFFEQYITQQSIFKDKNTLQHDFVPTTILHRDDQAQFIANVLAPVLKGQKPSNLFIYGHTGTGKTLVTRFTANTIKTLAERQNLPITVIYINCKLKRTADTEYRLVAQLCKEIGKTVPPTGLPTDEVYAIFYDELDTKHSTLLLILDEIDSLVEKADDALLYNLLRINEHLANSRIVLIGISNVLNFTESLDPRVRSSLSEERVVFPRYDAVQLLGILKQRAALAFHEGTLEEGVLQKCAALYGQENGDARLAINLLRTAGELCERERGTKVTLNHLDSAEAAIESDSIISFVKIQPQQHSATLYAIITACGNRKQPVFTGEIYDAYQELCRKVSLRPLTQRRVSDIINEFDMVGLIHSNVISKGRYGRTREISVALPASTLSTVSSLVTEALALPHG